MNKSGDVRSHVTTLAPTSIPFTPRGLHANCKICNAKCCNI